ncbi:hypothetical protein XENOCAPTIV_013472 [Xenoophorus captivus]|uniref:Uncharacterized protein n=1 Tax=Xenoophorus captivus TaxID=1517983 RepID=A0ABV0Q9T8_9TELE
MTLLFIRYKFMEQRGHVAFISLRNLKTRLTFTAYINLCENTGICVRPKIARKDRPHNIHHLRGGIFYSSGMCSPKDETPSEKAFHTHGCRARRRREAAKPPQVFYYVFRPNSCCAKRLASQ